jgi:Arc/MetJ-type ribon-helix-helix transcriptional regulator
MTQRHTFSRNQLAFMAKKTSTSLPLTFDLPLDLINKIESRRKALALRSTSEVVREALAGFNFNRYSAARIEHRQISVRLPEEQKALLSRHARKKSVSTGELVRSALVQLIARPVKKKLKAKG